MSVQTQQRPIDLADLPESKFCTKCQRDLPRERFRVMAGTATRAPRLAWICTACQSAYDRDRVAGRRARSPEENRRWRAAENARRKERRAAARARQQGGPHEQSWDGLLSEAEHLPVEPLRQWMAKTFPHFTRNPARHYGDLALELGVSYKTIRNIYTEPVVTVTIADRVFLAIGRPDQMESVYPLGDRRA
jgi:hypothetical protein